MLAPQFRQVAGSNTLYWTVPRPIKSDISALADDAKAIELLVSEADVPTSRLQEYWSLSADLISLVTDIEEYRARHPRAGYDDPALFTLKHRLRSITSRLADLEHTPE